MFYCNIWKGNSSKCKNLEIDEFSYAFQKTTLIQSAFSEIPSLFDAHTSIYHPCPSFLSQIALLLPWEGPSVIS